MVMCTCLLQRHELTPFPSNASLLLLWWAYDFLFLGVEGGVTHFTSCATFPKSALRKGGATGKVRHATLNKTSAFWKALTRLPQSYSTLGSYEYERL